MSRIILGFTLRSGDDYEAVHTAVYALSSWFRRLDDTQYELVSPYGILWIETAVRECLGADGKLWIASTDAVRTTNINSEWELGGQYSSSTRLVARRYVMALLGNGSMHQSAIR